MSKNKYTDEQIEKAVRSVYERANLGYLNMHVYDQYKMENDPSTTQVCRRFGDGSFKKALDHFNIKYDQKLKSGTTKCTKDLAIKMLKEYYEKNGKITARLFKKNSCITTNTVCELFGSWNNALIEAGIKTNQVYKYDKDELLKKLKAYYDRDNIIHYDIVLNDPTLPDPTTYARYFGTFINACKIAGIPDSAILQNTTYFGKRTIAKDGHVCDSKVEAILDDLLFENNIDHKVHVRYPNSSYKFDFVLNNNIAIEVAGMFGIQTHNIDELYTKKMLKKQEICNMYNIKLVILSYNDIIDSNKRINILEKLK